MAEYDKIAKEYSFVGDIHPKKNYMVLPTVFRWLGDLEGKEILDLACGDGFLSRQLVLNGAKKVTGIDISEEMIKIAKQKENDSPLNIEYSVGDVISLEKLGEFELVTGEFLLHYSKTVEELELMCTNIYKNLNKGGRFIGINANPDQPLTNGKKYGATAICGNKLEEGSPIKITIYDGEKELCSFINYHWSKQTYETAFKKAGFNKITWAPLEVSKEGIEKFGENYWRGALDDGNITLVEAVK